MKESATLDDIYTLMTERERRGATLYRFAMQGVADPEAKGLLEKLAQRCDSYRERLRRSKEKGSFERKACLLPDRNYAAGFENVEVGPEARLPEVLIFAIGKEEIDYRVCEEGAQRAADPASRNLWLALAEEERRQRLELEACYQKEVIDKV